MKLHVYHHTIQYKFDEIEQTDWQRQTYIPPPFAWGNK